jgi:synaptojanin
MGMTFFVVSNRGQCQPQNPPLAKIERLIGFDQLTNFRSRQLVFEGFEEHPVTFPPTYKYDLNSMQYDTSSKARAPAWCDRVVWSNTIPPLPNEAHGVPSPKTNTDPDRVLPVVQYYFSDPQSMTSDHRPVVAHISVSVRRRIAAAENRYNNTCFPSLRSL